MISEEDLPKKRKAFEIGQNLDNLSVDELSEIVSLLRAEIERLEKARSSKSSHLSAAEALFARKS